MSEIEYQLLGKYPDWLIRGKFVSELRATIEKKRGHRITLVMALDLAHQWEKLVEKTWKDFVVRTDEVLDHAWGTPGDDADWTEEKRIADFQWLYKHELGVDLSIEEARSISCEVIEVVKLLYELKD